MALELARDVRARAAVSAPPHAPFLVDGEVHMATVTAEFAAAKVRPSLPLDTDTHRCEAWSSRRGIASRTILSVSHST